MNIFFLDRDLDKCAEAHVDSHVHKIPLEVGQVLFTNAWAALALNSLPNRKLEKAELTQIKEYVKDNPEKAPYRPCHINHPTTIWLRSSLEHFYWAIAYMGALDSERVYRNNSAPHDTLLKVQEYDFEAIYSLFKSESWADPPAAVKDSPIYDDIVDTYRHYYIHYKIHLAKWTGRYAPSWYTYDNYPLKEA